VLSHAGGDVQLFVERDEKHGDSRERVAGGRSPEILDTNRLARSFTREQQRIQAEATEPSGDADALPTVACIQPASAFELKGTQGSQQEPLLPERKAGAARCNRRPSSSRSLNKRHFNASTSKGGNGAIRRLVLIIMERSTAVANKPACAA